MLEKFVNCLLKIAKPVTVKDGYNNEYIFHKHENDETYERIQPNRPVKRHICNVESFAKATADEISQNPSTHKTVIFDRKGGVLYTDDKLGSDQNVWMFERKYTTLWSTIFNIINYDNKLSHKELLDKLESIKIYVKDFNDLYNSILRLRATKKISFVSNPVFSDGENCGSYEWEQRVNDKAEKASCPSEIFFKGKIVRGSESEYEFSVQVTPVIDEERGQLLFSLSMPGFDMTLDQIMEDEFADFNKLIGEQDNLLILRDY